MKAKPKEGKGDEPMKRISIVSAAVLSSATLSGDGWALGLGELTLYSYLNEPFRAEVSLLEADALNDSDVHVDLASDAEFERLGVSRSSIIVSVSRLVLRNQTNNLNMIKDSLGCTGLLLSQTASKYFVKISTIDGEYLNNSSNLLKAPGSAESPYSVFVTNILAFSRYCCLSSVSNQC